MISFSLFLFPFSSGSDVYFSNQENMFQVFVNRQTGVHFVNIDPQFDVEHSPCVNQPKLQHRHRRSSSESSVSPPSKEKYHLECINASSLNTYITISQKNTILLVKNVEFRLVITLPEQDHNLRVSRFYIIIQSREDSARQQDKTFGILYFRQDQPHIDLFVFFSVFFSCFFLFLALCVMLWKMKQAFDARRSRQMREREMECMASRPFAKVLVLIENDDLFGSMDDDLGPGVDVGGGLIVGNNFIVGGGVINGVLGGVGRGTVILPPVHSRHGRLTRPTLRLQNFTELSPVHVQPQRTQHLSVAPIAVEPTDDGVAAVGTVLFQLPGSFQAPCHLCMGSTLTMRITPPQVAHKSVPRRRASSSTC